MITQATRISYAITNIKCERKTKCKMQSRNPFENLSKSNKILLLCVQIFDRNYWRWSGFLKIKGKYSSKTHIPMHIARSLNRSNSFASVDVWFCVWMPLDSCWVNYFYIFTIFPSWFVTPFWWGTCIEMSTYVFTLSKSARGKKNRKKEKRKRQKKKLDEGNDQLHSKSKAKHKNL